MTTALRKAIERIVTECDGESPDKLIDRLETLLRSCMAPPEAQQLSGSEALFGFAAWLTTAARFEKAGKNPKYGPAEHAGPWGEMVAEFCHVNELADPREGWQEFLTHPPEPE